jgi:hypothetical protein
MAIGEGHALGAEPIKARCRYFAAVGIERVYVAITQIIRQDVNDVGLTIGSAAKDSQRGY